MMDILRSLLILILVSFTSTAYSADDHDATDTGHSHNHGAVAHGDEEINQCRTECGELKPGQCRKPTSCSYAESAANSAAFFKVCRSKKTTKKNPKGKLTAHLSITFFVDNNPNGYDPDKIVREAKKKGSKAYKTNQKWKKRSQDCVKKFEKKLNDGKRGLDIKLHSPGDKKGLPNIIIEVGHKRKRTLDIAWRHDVSCETIIHELSHHMGLVDEYRERGPTLLVGAPPSKLSSIAGNRWYSSPLKKLENIGAAIKKWAFGSKKEKSNRASPFNFGSLSSNQRRSCRNLGDKDSIMRNSKLALNGRRKIRYIMCKCDKSTSKDLSGCKNIPKDMINKIYLSKDAKLLADAVTKNYKNKPRKGCPQNYKPSKVHEFKDFKNQTAEGFREYMWNNQIHDNRKIFIPARQGFKRFPVMVEVTDIDKDKGAYKPKHIDHIGYPNCADSKERKNYYKCASQAYIKSGQCKKCNKGWTK